VVLGERRRGRGLHLSWMTFWAANPDVMDAHQRVAPRHLALAREVAAGAHLAELAAEGAGVEDALDALWPALLELAGTS